ncbi:hypothetical protein COHA_007498 [Chlorella ohadii]|uniref:EF-hand domain-containing protein n=1 Tax=Chlorella ohadii TaxID=2649997 RepID=A0AAD5H3C8_9CHLO|nr:hypothetical protein COHA_007498 [Chlorella ohadii]
MPRAGAALLLAVLLLASAGCTHGDVLPSIYEAGAAALRAAGAPAAAAAFVPRAATVITQDMLKRWALHYQQGIMRLLPDGMVAQMPDNFMCIGPQGILAAQQQPFITISPVTEISTFPVNAQHQWGAHGFPFPNTYFDALKATCRTGNIVACILDHLSASHGFTGPVLLDGTPFVAPPGSGGPIGDDDIQFQMLLFNITMAAQLGSRTCHVVSGRLTQLLRSRAGATEVQVPFAGGEVTLMAIRLSDLLALLGGYEDDGSWLPSEEEDDDCWINLFTASHRCSRKSYAASESWAPTEAAAAQAAGAANLTSDDVKAFTAACSDEKEYTQAEFDDWRSALIPPFAAWLAERINKFVARGDSFSKMIQRTQGHVNANKLVPLVDKDGAAVVNEEGDPVYVRASELGGQRTVELAGVDGRPTMEERAKKGSKNSCSNRRKRSKEGARPLGVRKWSAAQKAAAAAKRAGQSKPCGQCKHCLNPHWKKTAPPTAAEPTPSFRDAYDNRNGTAASLDEVLAWFDQADVSGNNLVSFMEHEHWLNTQNFFCIDLDVCNRTFEGFDLDHDAHLNVTEFGQWADDYMAYPLEHMSKTQKIILIISCVAWGILIPLGCWQRFKEGCPGPHERNAPPSPYRPTAVHLTAPAGTGTTAAATATAPVHAAVVCLPGAGSSDLEKGSSTQTAEAGAVELAAV